MKKILIIEDERAYLKLLRDQLAKNGYEVIEAKDGEEGLAIAKSQRPDLILLDIGMPTMDGVTMLNQLREDEHGKSMKVIILTNIDPDDRILRTVFVDKPSYYLMKSDIQLADLLKKIETIFLTDRGSE